MHEMIKNDDTHQATRRVKKRKKVLLCVTF